MVRCMAISAHSRYHESALQEAFPVYAFGISSDYVVFFSRIEDSRLLTFPVASGTEHGDVNRKCRGL